MKPEDLQKKIEGSIPEIEKMSANLELMGAQSARVQLELRTFSTGGEGVKDIRGRKLKKYSEGYAKKREAAGLQTENKDLIFSKDTSIIKDSIDVGNSDGRPVLGFTRSKGAEIAGYQEKQNGSLIFSLNATETEKVKKDVKEYAMAQLRKIIEGFKE
jgi:hypothetical protein